MLSKTVQLMDEIKELKKKRQAIILSHIYQPPEVQDIADFIGDSLELSRQAAQVSAKTIVFCGVHFMAESAAILSPEKVVLLPEEGALCPMADMITRADLLARKKELPGALVLCYVNSSAEIKALSDICCTSASAVKIVQSLPPEQEILFVPDKNLGMYVASRTGCKIHLWDGFCSIHDRLRAEDILRAREKYSEAMVLAHPECRPEVTGLADAVSSTTGMLRIAGESKKRSFIVATETGILYQLKKQNPDKEFYPASSQLVCPDMKKTTLEKIHHSLMTMTPRVEVAPDVRAQALKSLNRMLELS